MLYSKIDGNGNPVEVSKNYSKIKAEFLANNSIIPSESVFKNISVSLGYCLVPLNGPPPSQAGKRAVPDLPVKNSNGDYERTWKYVEVSESEIGNMDNVMRERRLNALNKYIDSISPVRWNTMNETDKSIVEDYYKKLLDLPAHEAWPFVTLPEVPNLLN